MRLGGGVSMAAGIASSVASQTPSIEATAPWEVARDLQWRVARELLLDPLTWVGVLVAGWALHRTGVLGTEAALLALMGLATLQADELLFRRRHGDLLRTMPLGEFGFLRVCRAELGWWLHPARILVAAAASSDGGPAVAVTVWLGAAFAPTLGLRLAIALRRGFGARGRLVVLLPAVVAVFAPLPWTWQPLLVFVALGLLAGRDLKAAFRRDFPRLASDACTAPSARPGATWRGLSALARLLPVAVRARVVRDLVLLLRGRDVQGAILLLLSPLSCLLLVDELASMPSRASLPWRVLTCAALGGGAVAWAVGPGIHRLRNVVMSWERVAPHPGSRAMTGSLVYGLGLAVLHGGATLLTLALVQGGRFAEDVPMMALPVLGLEVAMAHYVVAYTMGATRGRRVAGEGTIVLALPVVAVAVALASVFHPALVLVYFVITAGMFAAGVRRYERVEVTW